MNNHIIRYILLFVSSLTFLLALFLLNEPLAEYKKGAAVYRTAAELSALSTSLLPLSTEHSKVQVTDQTSSDDCKACEPDSDTVSASCSSSIDLAPLRQVNPDVLGWISIPETPLSYPILLGEDNSFYLTHTWDSSENNVGSIFMEIQCSSDFSDFNTILYGHRMKDSSMFGSLKHYKDQEYLEEHPHILITDDSGTKWYQIYAAFEADVNAPIFLTGNGSLREKQQFIDYALAANVLETDVIPQTTDRLLTLCTCTGQGYERRWVVIGMLTNGCEPASSSTK